MSSNKQTVKCPICGEPYNIYNGYAGNQSACPSCVARADAKEKERMQPR